MAAQTNLPPLPPGFVLDGIPHQQPFGSRPVIQGPPPQPKEPKEPKTTYRPLSAQEATQHGLPAGSYQISSEGKVEKVADNKTNEVMDKQRQSSEALLKAAGVDLARGIDPVSDLISGSTSGVVQHLGAEAYGGVTGHATSGMENIGKLQTIVSDMVLQLTGGGLGNQISNADREFIMQRVGNLADPNVPADQRLAAWHQVKERMGNVTGVKPAADVRSEIETRIKRGDDPADTIHYLVSIGRPPDKQTIAAIIANANNRSPDVRPPDDGGGPGHAFGVGVGGVLQGVGDIANLVSSPFVKGVNAVTGSNLNPDMGENLRQAAGTPNPEGNSENLAFQVNRFGTNALNMAGLARRAAPFAGEVVGNALQRFGAAPLTDAVAGSAGGGASEATRQAGGGPIAQTAAGFIGGAATLPASSRMNALLQGPRPLPSVVRAGQQEGVTVNRAMVDPSRQQKLTAVGKTMVGGRMMQRDMGRIGKQIEGRAQALGGNGEVMEPAIAGQAVRDVAERSIRQSGQQLGRRYDRLEKATEGLKVPPKESLTRVDEVIGRLSEMKNSNQAEIAYLQNLRKDLGNDLSVGALRRLRTKLRKSISKGDLTFGEDEADVLSIMDSASNDIASGLKAAGKGGIAGEFKAVDQAYRERMDFIKGTVQKIVGKRNANLSGEQVFSNMKALTSSRGDAAGFARMIREMTPEEQQDIAATFADALGKGQDGGFSTATLVKHIEKLPPATRTAMFGPDGAKSLNNIAELALAHKRVTKSLGGSPTGLASDYRSYLWNIALGAVAGGTSGNAVKGLAVTGGLLAAKTGRDAVNARLLMSPKIAGWLRSAPRTSDPKAINAHFDRLKAIAVREPALAPEIQKFQEMMLRAANDTGTARAVASQGSEQNN